MLTRLRWPPKTPRRGFRGIPLSDNPKQINAIIVNTRNPLALAAKCIGTTTTVVIAFSGPDVPYLVHLPTLRTPPDHTCNPKRSLCGGPHLTAAKSCTARYKTPYVIRKRIGQRRAAMQVTLQESDFPPMNYKHRSRSRSPSRSRQHCSWTPSRSRQRRFRSRSTYTPPAKPPTNKVSFAEALTAASREEVRDLKQSKTRAPTPPAEASPSSSHDVPMTPAPKKKALQDGAAGQVRLEVKDMLVSLQSTMETLQNAVESVQHAPLALAQRVTNVENHLQTIPMPAPPPAKPRHCP
ncbi:hypothetical protein HPB49_003326 [Dermacentor silvarum]|uniref:Uncharacterized protein n=1 Tax=Dermacentor silvarum TaxID=543639 RepID=A0ACB8CV32_DERSI|nr:hypothetical protein HPB49_003326 [Dermacentor silvarum]